MSKKCYLCCDIISKDEIGLNRKLNGKNVNRHFCIKCLAEHLEVEEDDLLAKIEDFKTQGCALFE